MPEFPDETAARCVRACGGMLVGGDRALQVGASLVHGLPFAVVSPAYNVPPGDRHSAGIVRKLGSGDLETIQVINDCSIRGRSGQRPA